MNAKFDQKSSAGKRLGEVVPPLLFPARTLSEKRWMSELKAKGKIRSIGPRLYSSVPKSLVESTVRASWADIVRELFPNALLSHRSALEFKPDKTNTVYLSGPTNRKVRYPGLALEFIRAPAAIEEDAAFHGFHVSCLARALLENLSVSKTTRRRALPQERLEERLEAELQVSGEKGLNRLRDLARQVAEELGWRREFKKLNSLIGALLGTREADALKGPIVKARARGRPFDPACAAKLDLLSAELRSRALPARQDAFAARDHFRNKAFFEAYFSNDIEGTKFKIEEAEEIVFDSIVPQKRPEDAHDILGTFQIISDPTEIRRCPRSADELEGLLRSRHRILMSARNDVEPGEFKTRGNQAGNTYFVKPELVVGTLERGFENYRDLPKGLARAIYMMFLVAEIHPFNDGNGRIARVMMNAELQAEGLTSIIIPTVYRDDYLSSLRALSRRERPDPLVRALLRAQGFSHLEFAPYPSALRAIERRNWFEEPDEAKIIEG